MLRQLFVEREHRVPLPPAFFTQAQVLLELVLQLIRQLAVLGENYVLLCTLTVHDAYSNQPLQRVSVLLRCRSYDCLRLQRVPVIDSQRSFTSLARSLRVARKSVFFAVSSVVESISPIVLSFSPW